jgi:hypothetical protein
VTGRMFKNRADQLNPEHRRSPLSLGF